MTERHFSTLGLAEPLQRALQGNKYVTPTPIQYEAIPLLINGKDVMGIAQTGTGKTAAFALPILHNLSKNLGNAKGKGPRALIMVPTRELATQISEAFHKYGKFLSLRQTVVFGGVSQVPQVKALGKGVDLLIATPGRLLDLMNQKHVRLDAVECFVMDEADRMLDMGFMPGIRKIVSHLPKARQSLLFSATMAKEVELLAKEILSEPVRIEVSPQATPVDRIKQSLYHVDANGKKELLDRIIKEPHVSKAIVFMRTKHRANRVAEQLSKQGIKTEAIHGNKSQAARQKALQRFRSGQVQILVATDVAARGIDVDAITHVINYELPNEADSYIHRIGRTARAGTTGEAISFCDATERNYLRNIEKLICQKLTVIGDQPPETFLSESPKPFRAFKKKAQGAPGKKKKFSQRPFPSRKKWRPGQGRKAA